MGAALLPLAASDCMQQDCVLVEVMHPAVLWHLHGEHSCDRCRLLIVMYRVQALWS